MKYVKNKPGGWDKPVKMKKLLKKDKLLKTLTKQTYKTLEKDKLWKRSNVAKD